VKLYRELAVTVAVWCSLFARNTETTLAFCCDELHTSYYVKFTHLQHCSYFLALFEDFLCSLRTLTLGRGDCSLQRCLLGSNPFLITYSYVIPRRLPPPAVKLCLPLMWKQIHVLCVCVCSCLVLRMLEEVIYEGSQANVAMCI
jgi:hypothetical protein